MIRAQNIGKSLRHGDWFYRIAVYWVNRQFSEFFFLEIMLAYNIGNSLRHGEGFYRIAVYTVKRQFGAFFVSDHAGL